jgi:cellulose synthase/poly-beta-1,6-N-acetylglucosamine synthase-like glycosyltransferase/spore germination protein YaaH/peptidoglycan/xylan/chitin deacetylase (PgdA/CDA1 family)
METHKPRFYDEQRRRWRRLRWILEVTALVGALVLMVFTVSVLHRMTLPEEMQQLGEHSGLRPFLSTQAKTKAPPRRPGRGRRVNALGSETPPASYDPLRAAFYVSYDATSLASLQQHYRDIDVLITDTLYSDSADGKLKGGNGATGDDIQLDPKLAEWMTSSGVEIPIMPMVQNTDGTSWQVPETVAMLADPSARQNLVQQLVKYVVDHNNPGLVADFEEIPPASQKNFSNFVGELAAGLHSASIKLMVALPAGDFDYDYAGIAKASDAIIVMDYDQFSQDTKSGPIAAQDWYVERLQAILKLVPAQKVVAGVANYAYDWTEPTGKAKQKPATIDTFQGAVVTASESDANIDFDYDTLNPHFSYYDEHNQVHNVWMLDGVTAYNELRAAERLRVQGTALWRLGEEDGSLWTIWDVTRPDDAARARLDDIPYGFDLILEGQGDIWNKITTPQPGSRSFDFDAASNLITDETYDDLPMPYRIFQEGAQPKKIALSFDDGPDPVNTPQILNILKAKHAPATFFVIGVEANNALDLLRREYDEGHEIGNHTYTHPAFTPNLSRTQIELELNLNERLLASTLGIKTQLFRPPYGIDHQPETADEVEMLPVPLSMGYLLVGAQIDPHDWGEAGGIAPPPAQTIVDRVMEQARAGVGNIVLMHDGGGDRSHTIAALPMIIDQLRAAGYELVPVSDLIGETRAEAMPQLNFRERLVARTDGLMFTLFEYLRDSIAFVFVLGIFMVSLRALIIGLLALIEKLRPTPPEQPGYAPPVSVLIPAYDEESVIVGTVRAALASDYSHLEVIVVDDGSTDLTGELLDRTFLADPRVRIIHQPNSGKPAALRAALAEATSEVMVTIDADTHIEPDAVRHLVRHFANARVGAVAGNVKVGNRDRWITRWQALEYVTSQNLEKRAFDLLNCIPVVPGALSAWRTEAIRAAGGFTADTVAEDTDLTIAIRRAGWAILYDEDAIGWTEAPETSGQLVRQRFRWTFGTLQSFWKHRDTLGRWRYGTLGFVALPNIFLFQLLFPLLSPIIDLLFIGSLALWGLGQFHATKLPQFWTTADVELSLLFFAGFMLIDLLTCVIAFSLEKREDWSLLWPVLLQRFYYRQMMYVVLFRAVMGAVKGRSVGWRGVEAEVEAPRPTTMAPV